MSNVQKQISENEEKVIENSTSISPPDVSFENLVDNSGISVEAVLEKSKKATRRQKNRVKCRVEDCKSLARARGVCKRHGGAKTCTFEGCTRNVQSKNLCLRHGGGSRCSEEGCTRAAQTNSKCKIHGGGVDCSVPGCAKKAHAKKLCRTHGGGSRCETVGCHKWSQKMKLCMACYHRANGKSPTNDSSLKALGGVSAGSVDAVVTAGVVVATVVT